MADSKESKDFKPILYKYKNVDCIRITPIREVGTGDVKSYKAEFHLPGGSEVSKFISRADNLKELLDVIGQKEYFEKHNEFDADKQLKVELSKNKNNPDFDANQFAKDFYRNLPKFNMLAAGFIMPNVESTNPDTVKKLQEGTLPMVKSCVSSFNQNYVNSVKMNEDTTNQPMAQLNLKTFKGEKSIVQTKVKGEDAFRIRGVLSVKKTKREIEMLKPENFKSETDLKNAEYRHINFQIFMKPDEFAQVPAFLAPMKDKYLSYSLNIPVDKFNKSLKFDPQYGVQSSLFDVKAENFVKFFDTTPKAEAAQTAQATQTNVATTQAESYKFPENTEVEQKRQAPKKQQQATPAMA